MNRNGTQIMGEILNLASAPVSTSTLLRSANLPHPRLKQFLNKLTNAGLIVHIKKDYIITANGRILLAEWKQLHDLANTFGLEL